MREKVLIEVAKRAIIIADETKMVPRLGEKFPLPIEILPFALAPARWHLETTYRAKVELRMQGMQPYLTDNHNYILDCQFGGINAPKTLAKRLKGVTGILDHGIFPKYLLGLGDDSGIIVAGPSGVKVYPK